MNFTTEPILKSNLYARIKEILVSAGWKNVSSKAATDFDVFYSAGEEGTKSLYFQIRETDVNNANPLSTANTGLITARLINKYTPGAAGVAGVVERSAEPWRVMYLIPSTSVGPQTQLNLTWSCNKNRLIFIVETPYPLGLFGQLFYIGLPAFTYSNENNCDGLILAGTSISTTAANLLFVTNNTYVPGSASYTLTVNSILPPKNMNNSRKVFMSELAYGSTTEGTRGVIDDVYVMVNTHVLNGDILTDSDGQRYRVLITKNFSYTSGSTTYTWYNSFNTICLAIPIA